jgi:hypothetical protein
LGAVFFNIQNILIGGGQNQINVGANDTVRAITSSDRGTYDSSSALTVNSSSQGYVGNITSFDDTNNFTLGWFGSIAVNNGNVQNNTIVANNGGNSIQFGNGTNTVIQNGNSGINSISLGSGTNTITENGNSKIGTITIGAYQTVSSEINVINLANYSSVGDIYSYDNGDGVSNTINSVGNGNIHSINLQYGSNTINAGNSYINSINIQSKIPTGTTAQTIATNSIHIGQQGAGSLLLRGRNVVTIDDGSGNGGVDTIAIYGTKDQNGKFLNYVGGSTILANDWVGSIIFEGQAVENNTLTLNKGFNSIVTAQGNDQINIGDTGGGTVDAGDGNNNITQALVMLKPLRPAMVPITLR